MNLNLYELFFSKWFDIHIEETVEVDEKKYVKNGYLENKSTGKRIVIRDYIPRFVEDNNYTNSFGYQWNKFRNLQHDSVNGKRLTANRVRENTKWKSSEIEGKVVLECGSGPGRFTEYFYKQNCIIIAVDMSGAIDVNRENLGLHPNVIYIQDDITKLWYLKNAADFIFCYGVLQHTPNPRKTLHCLTQYMKEDSKISVDVYEKVDYPSPFYGPKYFWRPITKEMNEEKLLKIIKWYMPKYIKFDTFIRKINIAGCPIGGYILGCIPIPCWNYLNCGYSDKERLEHAIMDTFDALSPAYDRPCSISEFRSWAEKERFRKFKVFHGANGLVLNAMK